MSNENSAMFYFSLIPTVYAARFDESIILLDGENDKYLSLIGPAALYLSLILENSFQRIDAMYSCSSLTISCDPDQLNYWIMHFLEKNFIYETTHQSRKYIAPVPLKAGGLTEYQWDYKSSWKPFSHASKYQIIKALIELARVHRSIRRKGIKGIIVAIQKASHAKNAYVPNDHEINQLSAAVDAASLLYPKKTFCLAWAATFVLLALRKKWNCSFVIGIQTNPFYAHAWAEIAEKVVNDDPQVAQVLSIILKEPQT
jgi:hypothetical protein